LISLLDRTEDGFKIVSELAQLEARSAIRRRQFSGETPVEVAKYAVVEMQDQVERFVALPLTARVLGLASALVDIRNLRALDSIQLATALIARDALPAVDTLMFISSDTRLLDAAQAEGLETWDPASGA
jgi:predicted nucleic acid-binding protein